MGAKRTWPNTKNKFLRQMNADARRLKSLWNTEEFNISGLYLYSLSVFICVHLTTLDSFHVRCAPIVVKHSSYCACGMIKTAS